MEGDGVPSTPDPGQSLHWKFYV
ncbi:hypothetical protein OOU_Y34scaffold00744g29 [Pyricularia oryzae Y34]|uniref:Uncharacterized protein n=2 Tax=Pyricularia oryzae TaxID=318829 RepID=A0AA97NR61_PYRO3|nr:hypothetical protein OOU_Y34scaffold00744g29 [Pyricularia oryzae Y34]